MLLKYSQYQKRSKLGANGKPHRGSVTGSKIPNKGKGYRKGKIVSNKRLIGHRTYVAKREEEVNPVMTVDPTCDNSNDSGLGFDQVDYQPQTTSYNNQNTYWNEESRGVKRPRVDIKLESDNANDHFTFPQANTVQQPQRIFQEKVRKAEVIKGKIGGGKINGGKISGKAGGRSIGKKGCNDSNAAVARSRDGTVFLEILSQPENQHRARYQTEGSRGAVKDTSGNSFPVVKLSGYGGSEAAVLQVYIGTDQGKVAPHMFYQACKVSGKNSTPCMEKKLDGTVVIEIEFDPSKDNLVLCDCVGILKERNVDVEHRFPEEATARSRKKSTRCRMVFKTTITLPSGQTETLQVTSHPIACTQPPGIPEICKKSLSSCPVTGNTELFIIGKNFLKDTKVKFSEGDHTEQDYWECIVQPDKEFLHQSHLVCTVPRYRCEDIKEAANICVSVVSGGKSSEPVVFSYTPVGTFPSQHMAVLPTAASTSPTPATTSFFAVTPNLGSTSQAILQAVPERSNFPSPQKILIIPSNIDLTSPSVASASLTTDEKGLLKNDGVWIKEKLSVVQGLPQGSAMVPGLSQAADNIHGLTQASSVMQTLAQAPGLVQGLTQPSANVVQGLTQAANVVQGLQTTNVVQGLTQASNMVQGLTQVSNVVQELSQASNVVQNLAQTSSVVQGLAQASNVVQGLSQASVQSLTHSPSLVQSSSSQDNMILGVSPVSGIVQNPSSPTLLQDTNNTQTSSLIGISQQSSLLQVSDIVHPSGVLQGSPGSAVLQTSSQVLHSPELSPVSMSTSPVHQPPSLKATSPPLQVSLTESPVIDTLSQASRLMHSLGASSLVQAQNMTGSDLLQSPPSQTLVGSADLVPTLNHPHLLSPTLESPTSMVQSPPSLVKSSNLVLSPTMVHAQSPLSDLSPSTNLVHSSNVIDSSNLNPKLNHSTLLPNSVINSTTNLIPVTTIAEASSMIQSTSLIETNSMVQSNSLVNTVSLLNSGMSNSTLSSTNLVDVGSTTSVVRGLESTTPGGAASAVADLSSGQLPSMATIEKFVTATPLPALSVETYLSHIENKPKDNLLNTLPPTTETSPIAIKQIVAALDPKPAETNIFPGKNMDNINREVIHHSPVLLTPSDNSQSHINFQNQEFLPPQPTNFQLMQRQEQPAQAFGSAEFPPNQMFPPPPLYQETPVPQEKPKPPPLPAPNSKKCEEGIPVPHELTVMSENDLISYINPSCFDQV